MGTQKNASKTKQHWEKALDQAKLSFKSLATLEKTALAKARTLIRIPNAEERRQLTQERILLGLKKLGVATQSEVDALHEKIRKLEGSLMPPSSKKGTSGKSKNT